MQKQTEKEQLCGLISAMQTLEETAHKMVFDGNGFVLQDRIAGDKLLDEFLLVDWLDDALRDIQYQAKKRIEELN